MASVKEVKPVRQEGQEVDLTLLNQAELAALAKFIGVDNASLAAPRESLIRAIETLEDLPIGNPLDEIREIYSGWLKRYWDRFEMQVPYSKCPDCYQSCDAQVVACYMEDEDQIT